MHSPSNNTRQANDGNQYLISFVRPMRMELAETTQGWKVDSSSLDPSDAMMAINRDQNLHKPTILCGCGATNWVACVDGPIEPIDANAIIDSISSSQSPLEVECRMHSIISSQQDGGIQAQVRDQDDALAIVAESFRQYASTLLGSQVTSPDLGLMATLFERGDCIAVRPIETEVYDTFIDIGISSSSDSSADRSLIYDIYSDSWHGD